MLRSIPLMWMAFVSVFASAQDTRTVNEPTLPAYICATVPATKYIVSTNSVNIDPFNPTCGSTGGTFGQLGCTGGTSLEPSSTTPRYTADESSDYTAVQSALNACPSGSAVELVPSGDKYAFVLPPIYIPAGVTLIPDAGIEVYASRNPADYAGTNCGIVTSGAGGCHHWIQTKGISSSATPPWGIMGYGEFNGRGWDRFTGTSRIIGWYYNTIQAYCNAHGGAQYGSPQCTPNGAGNNQYGPNLIRTQGANNFVLYKATLRDSAEFMFEYEGTSGIVTHGLTMWGAAMIAPFEVSNTDGMDPSYNVQDITVADSFISVGDNQMAIKSDNGSHYPSGPVKNISVLRTHTHAGVGLALGSDTSGGISNILFDSNTQNGNLYSTHSAGVEIRSSTYNGGPVSNVLFQNHCMVNEYDSIRLYTNYGGQTGSLPPTYNAIAFKNLHVLASTAPYTTGLSGKFTFQGLSGRPITMSADNVTIDGTNQGISSQSGVTKDQYAQVTLGPGMVPVSLETQLAAGTGVATVGSSGTSSAFPCTLDMFHPLIGELLMQTQTSHNLQSYSASGGPIALTLQAVVKPATEVNAKESAPLKNPITFYDNGVAVGTALLGANGTLASLYLPSVGAGQHLYTAKYPADGHYADYSFGSLMVSVAN